MNCIKLVAVAILPILVASTAPAATIEWISPGFSFGGDGSAFSGDNSYDVGPGRFIIERGPSTATLEATVRTAVTTNVFTGFSTPGGTFVRANLSFGTQAQATINSSFNMGYDVDFDLRSTAFFDDTDVGEGQIALETSIVRSFTIGELVSDSDRDVQTRTDINDLISTRLGTRYSADGQAQTSLLVAGATFQVRAQHESGALQFRNIRFNRGGASASAEFFLPLNGLWNLSVTGTELSYALIHDVSVNELYQTAAVAGTGCGDLFNPNDNGSLCPLTEIFSERIQLSGGLNADPSFFSGSTQMIRSVFVTGVQPPPPPPASPVPLPASAWLLLGGVAVLLRFRTGGRQA